MIIRCIIVEDEPVSQDVLKKYIADCPNLKLIEVCNNAFEANDALVNHEVQLMFLDINMPRLSGMKFYKSLSNPPFVIFTTAYPEYALEGFEVDAVDYLLKPFPFERFLKAVNRVVERLKKQDNNLLPEKFILLKADKKIHKINIADLLYLEAMGDYVKVFFSDKHIIVHDTLQGLQSQLPQQPFFRVHKSYIIATEKFSYIEGNMVQIGEKSIPIGLTYRNDFLKLIKD